MEFQVQTHQGRGKQNYFLWPILRGFMENVGDLGVFTIPTDWPRLSLEPSLLIFPDGFLRAFPHSVLSLFCVTKFLRSHHQPFNHLVASPASGESLYSNHRSHGTSLLHPALIPRTLRAPEESFDFSLCHLFLLLHVGNADVLGRDVSADCTVGIFECQSKDCTLCIREHRAPHGV